MTSDDVPRIATGIYVIEAACPRCGAIEEILAAVRTVLTEPEDDLGTVRLKLKAKPREHDCRQDRLTITAPAVHQEPLT